MAPLVRDRKGRVEAVSITEPSSRPETSSEDQVLDILYRTLPTNEGNYSKYSNIEKYKEGGSKVIYKARWGPGEKEVVIKVDKDPTSSNAKVHVERGYTTERDLQVAASIKDPDENNILGVRDYYFSQQLKDLGYSGFVIVEDYFEGKTLDEHVKEYGTLNLSQIRDVFTDVLKAENYLVRDEKLLHRDPNTKNILVKRNGKLRAKLTDLTNAGKMNSLEAKIRPTSGSNHLLDPTIFRRFSGEEGKYNEGSEARALVLDMYYATTGQMPFRFDPETGIVENLISGKSLLNYRGIFDKEAYEKAVNLETFIRAFGASADAVRKKGAFYKHIRETYDESQFDDPEFLDSEVPQVTIEAFRPVYDMYREAARGMNVDVESLP